jgi:hypothetical protein
MLLTGAMLVVLSAAGCGGGGGDTTGEASSSLTKAAFLKKGNAICAKGNEKVEAGFESFSKQHHLSQSREPSDAVQEEAAEEVLIPAITAQLEEIRALGTPKGDEGELEEILVGAEEAVEEGEEDPATLLGNEPGKFTEVNKMARRYGLTVCGEEGG